MMTMYMTPYRRRNLRRRVSSDRLAPIGHIYSDVHVPLDVVDEKDAFVIYATVPGLMLKIWKSKLSTTPSTFVVSSKLRKMKKSISCARNAPPASSAASYASPPSWMQAKLKPNWTTGFSLCELTKQKKLCLKPSKSKRNKMQKSSSKEPVKLAGSFFEYSIEFRYTW